MKRKRKWLLCPLIIVALLLCAIPAYADTPALPHAFYGTLTIEGSPAPIGTVVTAKVGGVQCGSITTTVAGQYGGSGAFDPKLTVTGDIATGATISFFVGGIDTLQTYPFSPGGVTELNLSVGDTTPPSVTLTPLSPDPTNDNTPTFTGTATDSLSNISSVEYQVGTGAWRVWTVAIATDGAFDSPSEGYTFTIPALADGGYTVYVRATDAAANTTAEENYANDSFTVDTTAPTVVSRYPTPGQTDVPLTAVVTATFSEAMNASTITTSSFTLKIGATPVSGTVSYNSGTYTATFDPSANLTDGTTYTATLTTAITDVAGNSLAAEQSWSFSTGGDVTAPTVTSTSPTNGATGVAVDTVVTATFSEAMDSSTITTSSFTLDGVSGTVSYNSGTYTATFDPSADLAYDTTYTATLSTAITDVAGNPLASPYTWSFTTRTLECIPGDANEDGSVNALDITKVERIIALLDPETCGADANEDGSVNALDITKVERIIALLD